MSKLNLLKICVINYSCMGPELCSIEGIIKVLCYSGELPKLVLWSTAILIGISQVNTAKMVASRS